MRKKPAAEGIPLGLAWIRTSSPLLQNEGLYTRWVPFDSVAVEGVRSRPIMLR